MQRAWTAVADKLGKLDLTGAKAVPIDLDHKDWDTEVLELDPSPPRDSPEKSGSPPFKSRRQALAEKQVASPDSSTGSWQKISWSPGLPEGLPPSGKCLKSQPFNGAYEHPSPQPGWEGGGLRLATIGL